MSTPLRPKNRWNHLIGIFNAFTTKRFALKMLTSWQQKTDGNISYKFSNTFTFFPIRLFKAFLRRFIFNKFSFPNGNQRQLFRIRLLFIRLCKFLWIFHTKTNDNYFVFKPQHVNVEFFAQNFACCELAMEKFLSIIEDSTSSNEVKIDADKLKFYNP